ncbi:hypothetical protein AtubIFM54640_002162 [Aspergillus tubingensis]|nr:hypothetical protein AtubIFM54640_002162 [Aspergillus tubingensis]
MENITEVVHGYYPSSVYLPHYVTNESSALSLVAQFAVLWALVLGIASVYICRPRNYFVVYHKTLAGSHTLFGQLWKEYSLSDSRYLTSDSFLVSMEAVTAFCWGPLAFTIAYCIATQHPARHVLQLIVSVGQVYGDVLYYATSMFDLYYHGVSFCRPEGYYFWFYYFFMNFIWLAAGTYFAYESAVEITRGMKRLSEMDRKRKNN